MKKELIEEVSKLAAAVALEKRESIIKSEFDVRYHDIKLLMENYRKLKVHYEHTDPDNTVIHSIGFTYLSTGLMMSHVDKMLVAYEALCSAAQYEDEQRRWKSLYFRYLADEKRNADEVAEKLNIDRRTFYRDVGKAMEDMAVLLFGIEAIGTWKRK